MRDYLMKVNLDFNFEMVTKTLKKAQEGYFGWNDPANEHLLVEGLIKHLDKPMSPENLIDVAIYCMFLWNLRKGITPDYEWKKLEDYKE